MKISVSGIRRIIKSLNFSYKRMRKMKRNSKEIKLEFKRKMDEIGFEDILCFDEVGFQLEMNPMYGWSMKGERCTMIKNKGGRKNYTGSFIIGINGIIKCELKDHGMSKDWLIDFFYDVRLERKWCLII